VFHCPSLLYYWVVRRRTVVSFLQEGIIFMATTCAVCGKGAQFGRNIRHVHSGSWALRAPRTLRTFKPNLQTVRTSINGTPLKLSVCTKCIKAGKVARKA
jgi:large subunit ribosomal protein L28